MIQRVLVASRGDAARRVLASCRLAGIETVAVYSDPDAGSPHVTEADWAVHLPGSAPTATYLRPDLLVAAARRSGADAIHPGWGLLATDPDFAAATADGGRTWIGPPAKVLELLRDQPAAGAQLAAAGLAVPAGARAPRWAGRRADRRLDFQLVVDGHGNAVPLGERDCAMWRGQQPLLVEAPSPAVPPELRKELTRTAVRAATALGYVGAVTVELLVAPDGGCRVLGLDPQLSPEHAATECVTGVDLVRLQLLVAEQAPLPFTASPPLRGHAIAGQLRAEDPAYAWRPTAGPLHRFSIGPPTGEFAPLSGPGLRLDAAVVAGSEVTTRYGAGLATVAAWAPTRYEAVRRLARALTLARVHGVLTNRDLLVRSLRHPDFLAGRADAGFLDRHPELFAPLLSSVYAGRLSCLAAALAAAAARRAAAPVLGTLVSGWRNVPTGAQTTVYSGPMGTVEIGYRLDRAGELESWRARAVDPDELDLAGLSQPVTRSDHRPPVALGPITPDQVVLDVAGVRTPFSINRVGDVTYVDSPEGSVVLTEQPRYRVPAPPDEHSH